LNTIFPLAVQLTGLIVAIGCMGTSSQLSIHLFRSFSRKAAKTCRTCFGKLQLLTGPSLLFNHCASAVLDMAAEYHVLHWSILNVDGNFFKTTSFSLVVFVSDAVMIIVDEIQIKI
jgi:hypothetical protein